MLRNISGYEEFVISVNSDPRRPIGNENYLNSLNFPGRVVTTVTVCMLAQSRFTELTCASRFVFHVTPSDARDKFNIELRVRACVL